MYPLTNDVKSTESVAAFKKEMNICDGSNCLCTIDDYAKDGGEELFTKMYCVLIANP